MALVSGKQVNLGSGESESCVELDNFWHETCITILPQTVGVQKFRSQGEQEV